MFDRRDGAAGRTCESNARHCLRKQCPIFGDANGTRVGADQLAAVLSKHAAIRERERNVQRRLTAHRWEDGIGAFTCDDLLNKLWCDRLDIRAISEFRIRHDGSRIGIHENDLVPLFAQRFDRLRPGVIKFGSLTDHNRPRADHKNTVQVSASRHEEGRR